MSNKHVGKDFMSIKEFAGFVGMTISALRHYDKTGVFLPAKHGVEFENKYRYYAPTQITTVKMIRVLTEIGVPLKTIKELAGSRTPEIMIKLLSGNKSKIADEIRFLQEVYSVINTFTDLLHEGMSVAETEISVSEMPEKRLTLGDMTDFSGSTEFYGEFIRFCKAPHDPVLNLSYPIGGYWMSMAAFLDESTRPMRFFSLDPKGHERTSFCHGLARDRSMLAPYPGIKSSTANPPTAHHGAHGQTFNSTAPNPVMARLASRRRPLAAIIAAFVCVQNRLRARLTLPAGQLRPIRCAGTPCRLHPPHLPPAHRSIKAVIPLR